MLALVLSHSQAYLTPARFPDSAPLCAARRHSVAAMLLAPKGNDNLNLARSVVGSLGQASLFQSASVRGTCPTLGGVLMLACLIWQDDFLYWGTGARAYRYRYLYLYLYLYGLLGCMRKRVYTCGVS